jgi:hypothetical protein
MRCNAAIRCSDSSWSPSTHAAQGDVLNRLTAAYKVGGHIQVRTAMVAHDQQVGGETLARRIEFSHSIADAHNRDDRGGDVCVHAWRDRFREIDDLYPRHQSPPKQRTTSGPSAGR